MNLVSFYIILVLFLPLFGGCAQILAKKKNDLDFLILTTSCGLITSLFLFASVSASSAVITWNWARNFSMQLNVDRLASILVFLVYFVGLLIVIFSSYYLRKDGGVRRYGLKLGFFISSMIGLVIADSVILFFLFWELVGVSSYALISFWFKEPEKAKAAKEVFMINRVADAFLLVGILILMADGNLFFSSLSGEVQVFGGLCLIIGAFGKSAQLPFAGWLPKAMAGPTPVSALIHAATMVTAGVYLLLRVYPVLPEPILLIVALVGALTSFYGSFSSLSQYDIKGVLAYSTVSQLGLMMVGVGVGSAVSATFHLWTHAFFKAGLFLSAGSVIIYMHHAFGHQYDPQDMRNMGGLRRFVPITFWCNVICGLALAGIPFFSGFMSKEGIVSGAVHWSVNYAKDGFSLAYLVPTLAFFTTFLTPVYIARQISMVYAGEPRLPIWITGFRQSLAVQAPLVILAVLSLWIFAGLNPFNGHNWWLSSYVYPDFLHVESGYDLRLTLILSLCLISLAALFSYFLFGRGKPLIVGKPSNFFSLLSIQGWFLSRSYDFFSTTFIGLSKLLARFDQKVVDYLVNLSGVAVVISSKVMGWVDRYLVDGIVSFSAKFATVLGSLLSRLQSRGIQTQILYMLIIFILLLIWIQS